MSAESRKAVAATDRDMIAIQVVLDALAAYYGEDYPATIGPEVTDLWNAGHDAMTAIHARRNAIESAARWAAIPPEQMGNAILAAQNID
jgi:hypothetical protein